MRARQPQQHPDCGSRGPALHGPCWHCDLERASDDPRGLYETADGLKIVNSRGTELVRWQLIDRFEHSRSIPKSRVLVIGKNGGVVPVVGTAQGARIAWDDGETNDIVGELNRRLELWRSHEGLQRRP